MNDVMVYICGAILWGSQPVLQVFGVVRIAGASL